MRKPSIFTFLVGLLYCLAIIAAGSFLSITLAEITKGKNYSDVGVAMYTNSGFGIFCGLLTYISIAVAGYYLGIKIFDSKDISAWYVALNVVATVVLLFLLGFITNY